MGAGPGRLDFNSPSFRFGPSSHSFPGWILAFRGLGSEFFERRAEPQRHDHHADDGDHQCDCLAEESIVMLEGGIGFLFRSDDLEDWRTSYSSELTLKTTSDQLLLNSCFLHACHFILISTLLCF